MDDEQLKNAIAAIKSRIYSAVSQAELAQLGMAAAGLLSFTNSPEIEGQIRGLQEDVRERTEAVEKALSSEIISSNEKGRYADDKGKTKELDDLAVENDKIYAKFLLTHEEDLANNKKDTDKLGELAKAIEGKEPISAEQEKQYLKTPEQIQAELRKNQRREAAEQAAIKEARVRATNIERLRREAEKAPPSKREEIQAQIEQQEGRQQEVLSLIGAGREHSREYLRKAKNVYKISEAAKKSGTNQEVADKVAQQFVERVTIGVINNAIEIEEASLDSSNVEFLGWMKSVQSQKKVMENPEVAKAATALANAVKNALEGQQAENGLHGKAASSGPLHPPPTPNVKKTAQNKGHDDHGRQ